MPNSSQKCQTDAKKAELLPKMPNLRQKHRNFTKNTQLRPKVFIFQTKVHL